jgi:methionyl-tRNA formyltransferase
MKLRILFMGTPAFAVPALQALIDRNYDIAGVVCQPDKPVGRHRIITAPPVKQLAISYNIPVLQPVSLRSDEAAGQIAELSPDMIVTAAYGKILPRRILDIPALGCLNVHASLLPLYRGASPVQWSIINGDRETGVTIMMMDEGLDTGDILVQQSIPVSENIDAAALMEKLSYLGASMLPRAIEDFISGDIVPYPQNDENAVYVGMLDRQTGKIDWSRSARDIHNLIRGTYPWPGAWTGCGGKKLKIHRSQISYDAGLIASAGDLEPGTICACGEILSVATGDGVIELLEVQNQSGRRMHCRDCAHNYKLGEIMGGKLDNV